MDREKIEKAVKIMLESIGEDVNRKGLKETPKRVAKMFEEILSGYKQDPKKVLGKVFYEEFNELVLVKDILFYSLCEHHMLPFFGKVHIAYIPDGKKVVGISKFARLVDVFTKRLQLQERITNQIADTIMETLTPQGAMVVIEAQHLCMIMRGVKKPESKIVTSAMRGVFLRDLRTRAEALNLIMEGRTSSI